MPQDPSTPSSDPNEVELSQASLTALTNAIISGINSGNSGLPNNTNKQAASGGGDTDLSTDRDNLFVGDSEEEGSFSSFLKFSGRMLGQISEGTKAGLEMMYNQLKRNSDLSNDLQNQLAYFFDARKKLGNISFDLETGAAKMDGITKQYVEQYEAVFISATDSIADIGMEFTEGYGQNLDAMFNFFESAEAAAEKFSAIMQAVISDTPNVARTISESEAKRITFFSETLQIAERDVATFLKRQYAYTGETTDEILGQIGTTSKALSEATGISANQLKTGIVEVMRDVDKFGDIGVDSAGRISAALSQLGVDFQSFQSLTDQFMNFDNAANKMGELSTLFGVQLDAMEMTYLANEDQEEFLYRMREEILDAGVDVENISKTRARALASQLNMSVTEMKTFLREGELAVDQTQMTAATDAAANMDALTVAGRDFGNEFARSTQDAAKMIEDKFKKQIIESRDELSGLAREVNDLQTAAGKVTFPKEFTDVRKSFTKLRTEIKDSQGQMFTSLAGYVNAAGQAIGGTVAGLATGIDALSDAAKTINDKLLEFNTNSPTIARALSAANISADNVTKAYESGVIEDAEVKVTKKQLDDLTKAIEDFNKKDSTVKLEVESKVNGDEIVAFVTKKQTEQQIER